MLERSLSSRWRRVETFTDVRFLWSRSAVQILLPNMYAIIERESLERVKSPEPFVEIRKIIKIIKVQVYMCRPINMIG